MTKRILLTLSLMFLAVNSWATYYTVGDSTHPVSSPYEAANGSRYGTCAVTSFRTGSTGGVVDTFHVWIDPNASTQAIAVCVLYDSTTGALIDSATVTGFTGPDTLEFKVPSKLTPTLVANTPYWIGYYTAWTTGTPTQYRAFAGVGASSYYEQMWDSVGLKPSLRTTLGALFANSQAFNVRGYVVYHSGAATPNPPTLSTPANGATSVSTAPSLTWQTYSGNTGYAIQLSTDPAFGTHTDYSPAQNATSQAVTGLTALTTYYWRMTVTTSGGTSAWSSVFSFVTSGSLTTVFRGGVYKGGVFR